VLVWGANTKGASVEVATEAEDEESEDVDASVTRLNEALEVVLALLLPEAVELLSDEESVAVELEVPEVEYEEDSPLIVEVDSPDEVSSSADDEEPDTDAEELEDPELELVVGAATEELVESGLVTGVLDPPSAKPKTPCAQYPASVA